MAAKLEEYRNISLKKINQEQTSLQILLETVNITSSQLQFITKIPALSWLPLDVQTNCIDRARIYNRIVAGIKKGNIPVDVMHMLTGIDRLREYDSVAPKISSFTRWLSGSSGVFGPPKISLYIFSTFIWFRF